MTKRKYDTYASHIKKRYYTKRTEEERIEFYTEKLLKSIYRYRKTRTKRPYTDYERTIDKNYYKQQLKQLLLEEYKNLPNETKNKWNAAYSIRLNTFIQIGYGESYGTAKNIERYLNKDIGIKGGWVTYLDSDEEYEFRNELQDWYNRIIPKGNRKDAKIATIANIIYTQSPAFYELQQILNKYFPEDSSVTRLFYA